MSRRRNVSLDAELSDDRETYDPDAIVDPLAEAPAAPVVVAPSPAAAPLPAGLDLTALAHLLATAIQQGTKGAIEQTQPAKRERESWEFEHKSSYNPAGELHHPRPALACPVFWGALDENDPNAKPAPLYDFDPAQCTVEELHALNSLTAGRGTIKMYDGTRVPVSVYLQHDLVDGTVTRKVIALPRTWFDKQHRNQIPNVRVIAAQLQVASAG